MSEAAASRMFTLVTVVGCGAAYALFYWLNHVLFNHMEFTRGVNWVFLPSGLRLSLVLIFLGWGALGIALASMAISYFAYDQPALFSLVVGSISGLAPWLARHLSLEWLRMDPEIQLLSPMQLLQLAVLFSVTSPVLHQLWFAWIEPETQFLQGTVVMIIGDLLGTLLVLFALRLFILWLRTQRAPT